jgi:hypothetical protein
MNITTDDSPTQRRHRAGRRPTTTTLTLWPKAGRFDAYLDGQLICTSRQPLLDGARELLRRGCDPAALLTTRHEGKPYDNFVPAPIGELAKLTCDGEKFAPWAQDKAPSIRNSVAAA